MTESTMSRGDSLEVTIDRMAHGGEGIGQAPDGRVVFVPRAFPGDVVKATAGR
ncbi:TRAM domain-containing protein, partial [Corynebacterium parakroppenstedtii]